MRLFYLYNKNLYAGETAIFLETGRNYFEFETI